MQKVASPVRTCREVLVFGEFGHPSPVKRKDAGNVGQIHEVDMVPSVIGTDVMHTTLASREMKSPSSLTGVSFLNNTQNSMKRLSTSGKPTTLTFCLNWYSVRKSKKTRSKN